MNFSRDYSMSIWWWFRARITDALTVFMLTWNICMLYTWNICMLYTWNILEIDYFFFNGRWGKWRWRG